MWNLANLTAIEKSLYFRIDHNEALYGKDVQLGDKLNCSEGNQRQKRNNILEMGGLLFEHRIKKRDQRPRLTINLTLSELYTRIAAFRPYKPYQEVNQQEQDNTA
ncbi:unnamed protein product [Gordionus sp. m RMFG-2023]